MIHIKSVLFLAFTTIPFWGYSQTWTTMTAVDQEVEVIVDHWGLPHIYAQNQNDLFFAQGYHAAKDRLFQFEIWRRQATGTVAELLGPTELDRDIGTRLFKFRKNINTEMAHYHPDGVAIINAYVDGVNTYIRETHDDPSLLPIEFRLLNTCLLYTSPSPRDLSTSRMPSSA